MRTARTTSVLASLILATGLSDLYAQQQVSNTIDGFNGMPWGSSELAVRTEFGDPTQADVLENGIVVLAYRDTLLGEPSVSLYAILGDQGLIKGQHAVKLRLDKGNCEGQYRVYRDHVTLTYPLIVPIENYDFPFTDDFCTAIEEGTGEWANQWKDSRTGSVATVIVQRGTDEVKLIYESRAFIAWLESQQAPEGQVEP